MSWLPPRPANAEPAPPDPAQRPEAGALAAASALAVVLGVLLRTAGLGRKAFWTDESWVAFLAEMPLGEFFATIPRTTAPVGFALAVKLTALIPGLAPEIAMRLLPLAAGIATLLLLPRLVRALGGSPRAAALAALIAAAMPALVHYSRELKPYAIDAFVATAFPLAALRLLSVAAARPELRPGPARWLPAGFAVLTPLFSFAGVFPVVATLCWGWVHLARRRLTAARRPWAAATIAFGLLLAAVVAAVIYRQLTNPVLEKFFPGGAPGTNLSPAAAATELARLLQTLGEHLFPGAAPAGLLLAALGLAAWPRAGRGAALGIAGGSLALAALAAAAGLYAVNYGRLVLFAAPFAVAAVSVGIDRVLCPLAGRLLPRLATTAIALALAGSLAGFWAARDFAHRLHPERSTWRTSFLYDELLDVPALVEETLKRRAPAEPVLVSHTMSWPVRYYGRGRLADVFPVAGRGVKGTVAAVEEWLQSVPERGWLMLIRQDAGPRLREAVAAAGFAVAGETPVREAVLWEVRRTAAPGTPAP